MNDPDQDAPPPAGQGSALFSLSQIRHLMRVEFSRAQRYRYSLAVLVIAVDRLRTLRELHGFEAAAELRTRLVALLEAGARVCDYLGRLVDDRLVLVLPHTDRAGVESAARRYLEGARQAPLDLPAGRVAFSLSIGAALYDGGPEVLFFESLLERAEAACAAALAAGGDRLELAGAASGEGRR